MSNNEPSKSRLREILSVIRKHNIARGVSPEKIRLILEDLGPTYIKLGQIMASRSDILPQSICDELTLLRSDVTPMPYSEVNAVIREAYGNSIAEEFEFFDRTPIGSASIAQVHHARLKTGEDVVVKVQRQGIYETMQKDMTFLHRMIRMMPSTNMTGMVDMKRVLDEIWMVAQDEMNFLTEASNLEEFYFLNKDVTYVSCPKVYREYTTRQVLVMEFINAYKIDDRENLQANGYDLNEIGQKLADNYIKQIMEDGYFHADPHQGNIRIRDGQIVWIDMGMMGHFSPGEQRQISRAIEGVALHDVSKVVEAVMAIGVFHDQPDQKRLYSDVSNWLARFGNIGLDNINMGEVFQNLAEIMRDNKMSLPSSLTMLVRGLTTIEGVLKDLAPEISVMEVAKNRLLGKRARDFDLQKELKDEIRELYLSIRKGVRIPSYLSDMLHSYMNGQTRINLDIHTTDDLNKMLNSVTRNVVMGLLIAALLVSSSIICTTNMTPKILEIPLLGFVGYMLAFVLTVQVFIHYLTTRKRRRRRR